MTPYLNQYFKYRTSSSQEVLSLYEKYAKVQSMLKDSTSSASKKSRGSATKSRLSLKFLTLLLKSFISDVTPAHQESLNALRSRDDLFRYLVSSAHDKLLQVRDKGKCEGPEGHLPDKLFKYTCTLGKALLSYYSDGLHGRTVNSTEKSYILSTLCLETFVECCNIVCLRYKSRMIEFLQTIERSRDSEAGEADQEIIYGVIKKFQRLMMAALSDTTEEECGRVKDAALLLHVIGRMSRCMPHVSQQYLHVHSWLRKLCVQQNLGDNHSFTLTNQLLTLLIEMTSQQKSVASLLIEIARDLHTKMGDIDQEIEIEDECNLSIISCQSGAQHVLPLLLTALDRELEDVDWLISRLRADINTGQQAETVDMTQREGQEKSACSRLGHFINVFHELVQSAVPSGTHTEQMLKYLTRIYNSLSSLVKLYLFMYQSKQGHMSTRFEKLVKHSGNNLTPYVYAMITYIQATQKEGIQQASEKGKRKGKKPTAADILGKSRIMKETRSIPSLIYAIEQYERYLINLTKKSKIDLMEHFKMSTSRDFRIQAEVLNEVLDAQNHSSSEDDDESSSNHESENESDNEDVDEENKEPTSKKRKTGQSKGNGAAMSKASKLAARKKRSSVY